MTFYGIPFDPSTVDAAGAARTLIARGAGLLVGGKLRAELGSPPPGRVWYVRRIVVKSPTDSGAAYVYRTSTPAPAQPDDSDIVDGTSSGTFDVAEYQPPGLFVDAGQRLTVFWPSAVAGPAWAIADYVESTG